MFSTKNVDTTPLSQKAILDKVSQYDLWMYYLGHCNLHKAFSSPLRKDKKPSAMLYMSAQGKIIMKDFGNGKMYDIFKFLEEARGYTYSQTLITIDADFQLGMGYRKVFNAVKPVITGKVITPEPKQSCHIMLKRCDMNARDLAYWKSYHITKSTLKTYNVSSLECYWVIKDGQAIQYDRKNNPIFCYDFGEQKYKIYKPLDHNFRFVTNAGANVLQGISQLPDTGELLIITKALKDVMVLHEAGYNAVAVQSENTFPDNELMRSLLNRFNRCVVLFDNDQPGIDGSEAFSKLHDIQNIMIPRDYKVKDIAEFAKLHGLKHTHNLISTLLWQQTGTELQDTIGKEK